MNFSEPQYFYRAKLARIVDGDTVYLEVDLGFQVTGHFEFRLAGINTPETRGAEKSAGIAAKNALAALLHDKSLIVHSEKSGKYGRWLGTLWVPNGDGTMLNVNEELVKTGFAEPYMIK